MVFMVGRVMTAKRTARQIAAGIASNLAVGMGMVMRRARCGYPGSGGMSSWAMGEDHDDRRSEQRHDDRERNHSTRQTPHSSWSELLVHAPPNALLHARSLVSSPSGAVLCL
ncbi:hypothetical protein [Pelagibius sp.]|uniref:hypothetical protein n=1 Tax=Pelagibius sp. TaxID=1931238 RepID=UPI003B5068A1